MNAQPTLIPETVTVTLTREEIEAYAGDSDQARNDLVSKVTTQGAADAVRGIVREALFIQGVNAVRRERRTVSREHAGVGLFEALLRMDAALKYALTLNLDPEENETARMALEGGYRASGVAMEIMNALDLGSVSEDTPTHEECFTEWSEHATHAGNYLTVDDADVPKSIYFAARVHFNLDDEQLDEFKTKVREHNDIKRRAIALIQQSSNDN